MEDFTVANAYAQLVPLGAVPGAQLTEGHRLESLIYDANGNQFYKHQCYHHQPHGTSTSVILGIRSFVAGLPCYFHHSPGYEGRLLGVAPPPASAVTANVDLIVPMEDTFLGRHGLMLPFGSGEHVKVEVQHGCHQVLLSELGEVSNEVRLLPKWKYVTDKQHCSFAYVQDPPTFDNNSQLPTRHVLRLFQGAGAHDDTMHVKEDALQVEEVMDAVGEVPFSGLPGWPGYGGGAKFYPFDLQASIDQNKARPNKDPNKSVFVFHVYHSDEPPHDRPLDTVLKEWLDQMEIGFASTGSFIATKDRLWGKTRILVSMFSRLMHGGYQCACWLEEDLVVVQCAKGCNVTIPTGTSPAAFQNIAEAVQYLHADGETQSQRPA